MVGEFNRSVQRRLQSIGRSFEGQGLSRALIEPQSNEFCIEEAWESSRDRDSLGNTVAN